ncbi:MAG: hypothetical protein IH960_05275 [Chloroflexi bacterium]|nr:hypothetical protein [Chloroflexota bacterium]
MDTELTIDTGLEGNGLTIGRPGRSKADGVVIGQLPHVGAIGVHHRQFQRTVEAGSKDDGTAIGRPGGVEVPSGTIAGRPGSSGKVTGTARVIIKLSDAGRLNKGEILVTATTSPPWTPLFATAGGIVTDTGGALSHCAIVAREYGIPATVGAAGATFAIKDGDQIEVDGDAGTVRIL